MWIWLTGKSRWLSLHLSLFCSMFWARSSVLSLCHFNLHYRNHNTKDLKSQKQPKLMKTSRTRAKKVIGICLLIKYTSLTNLCFSHILYLSQVKISLCLQDNTWGKKTASMPPINVWYFLYIVQCYWMFCMLQCPFLIPILKEEWSIDLPKMWI